MATAYPARVPSAFPFLLWSRAVPSHSVIRLLSTLLFSYINLSCYNSLDEELANIWRIWPHNLPSWGKVNKHSQADDQASIFSGKDAPVCMVRAFPPRSAAPPPAPTWPQEGPVLRVGQGRRGWRPRCPYKARISRDLQTVHQYSSISARQLAGKYTWYRVCSERGAGNNFRRQMFVVLVVFARRLASLDKCINRCYWLWQRGSCRL